MTYMSQKGENDYLQWCGVLLIAIGIGWMGKIAFLESTSIYAELSGAVISIVIGLILMNQYKKSEKVLDTISQKNNK